MKFERNKYFSPIEYSEIKQGIDLDYHIFCKSNDASAKITIVSLKGEFRNATSHDRRSSLLYHAYQPICCFSTILEQICLIFINPRGVPPSTPRMLSTCIPAVPMIATTAGNGFSGNAVIKHTSTPMSIFKSSRQSLYGEVA